jgi:nucleoside-diphosphate-sugar epimerase
MSNEEISIFGDGRILRDYLYVDDLTDAFICIASCEQAYGEVYNVGSGIPISFIDVAEKIIKIASKGKIKYTEFTSERKALEPGDYYADISKIKKVCGWFPITPLDLGIKKTIEYYNKYKSAYW